jgi:hypothetical protein
MTEAGRNPQLIRRALVVLTILTATFTSAWSWYPVVVVAWPIYLAAACIAYQLLSAASTRLLGKLAFGLAAVFTVLSLAVDLSFRAQLVALPLVGLFVIVAGIVGSGRLSPRAGMLALGSTFIAMLLYDVFVVQTDLPYVHDESPSSTLAFMSLFTLIWLFGIVMKLKDELLDYVQAHLLRVTTWSVVVISTIVVTSVLSWSIHQRDITPPKFAAYVAGTRSWQGQFVSVTVESKDHQQLCSTLVNLSTDERRHLPCIDRSGQVFGGFSDDGRFVLGHCPKGLPTAAGLDTTTCTTEIFDPSTGIKVDEFTRSFTDTQAALNFIQVHQPKNRLHASTDGADTERTSLRGQGVNVSFQTHHRYYLLGGVESTDGSIAIVDNLGRVAIQPVGPKHIVQVARLDNYADRSSAVMDWYFRGAQAPQLLDTSKLRADPQPQFMSTVASWSLESDSS